MNAEIRKRYEECLKANGLEEKYVFEVLFDKVVNFFKMMGMIA